MADNYLEKRYAEVFGGAPKAASHRPSLDVLVGRIASPSAPDASYAVHQRQLDAVVAAAKRLAVCDMFSFETAVSAGPGRIVVRSSASECPETFIALGSVLQTLTLKAAEMGLRTTGVVCGEEQLYALDVFKPL